MPLRERRRSAHIYLRETSFPSFCQVMLNPRAMKQQQALPNQPSYPVFSPKAPILSGCHTMGLAFPQICLLSLLLPPTQDQGYSSQSMFTGRKERRGEGERAEQTTNQRGSSAQPLRSQYKISSCLITEDFHIGKQPSSN